MPIVNNVKVFGLEDSIRAAKFPMSTDISKLNSNLTPGIDALAAAAPGSGHDVMLTGIVVQFDLTLSVKCWTEFQRYHFADFVSSQSTMHRITKFNLDNAYMPQTDPRIIEIMKEKVADYNYNMNVILPTLEAGAADTNNDCGKKDLENFHNRMKEKYLEILYSNPAGFRLTARITTNYRQLKTMYYQRKDHRLPEWREFCAWIKTLPCAHLIIKELKENENGK